MNISSCTYDKTAMLDNSDACKVHLWDFTHTINCRFNNNSPLSDKSIHSFIFDSHFDRINRDAQPDPNSNPSSSLIHAANVEASVPQTPTANRPKITTARANA